MFSIQITVCACFYNAALLKITQEITTKKQSHGIITVLESFLDYPRIYHVMAILLALALSSFHAIIHKY